MIKVKDPYSVFGFKMQQIEVLLNNLNHHIDLIKESRDGKSDVHLRAVARYLLRSQNEFKGFKKSANNLKEVKDGLV